jgi:TIR domain
VISYRRQDTPGGAGRLRESLAAHFGRENVFLDIDTIPPGVDWVEAIRKTVAASDALLPVIGMHWLTVTDENGRRRIDDPNDILRFEIESALESGVRVIPVQLHGAPMPSPDDLPESLAGLTRRQSIRIDDDDWHYDVQKLVRALESVQRDNADAARAEHDARRAADEEKRRQAAAASEHRRAEAAALRRAERKPLRSRLPKVSRRWAGLAFAAVVLVGVAATIGVIATRSDAQAEASESGSLIEQRGPRGDVGAPRETPVLETEAEEWRPIAGSGYLVWAESPTDAEDYTVMGRELGEGEPFVISEAGKQGRPGAISNGVLVYQEYVPGEESDIRYYDLSEREHLDTPSGVNTDDWEWYPAISGDGLVFVRVEDSQESVLLVEGTATRTLDSGETPEDEQYARLGQAKGRYVVWQRCTGTGECAVVRYDRVRDTSARFKPPAGKLHYGASVTSDGTVYLGRSAKGCGNSAEIWRYPLDGKRERILALPDGYDFSSTYAEGGPLGLIGAIGRAPSVQSNAYRPRGEAAPSRGAAARAEDGDVDLYYDRSNCDGGLDAYRVEGADSIPAE